MLCALTVTSDPACSALPLQGTIVDFTDNHRGDKRIYSRRLGIKRDMYVYLPPGYDPQQAYPLMLWLHGFGGDEKQFLRQVVCALDEAIVRGELPPLIAACPDGSLPTSVARPWHSGSWYINSKKGCWEDYIFCDVLPFLENNFSLLPQREARVIAGWSMGGFAAYNLGIKHSECFHYLVGVYPNLNPCYAGNDGKWHHPFDPANEGRLASLRWYYKLGDYPNTRIPILAGMVYCPVWGSGPRAVERMSQESPTDHLLRFGVQPGQFQMFVAYGGNDEYNIDAQVESFLYHARSLGLTVWERRHPYGHHRWDYVNECLPDVFRALGEALHANLSSSATVVQPQGEAN